MRSIPWLRRKSARALTAVLATALAAAVLAPTAFASSTTTTVPVGALGDHLRAVSCSGPSLCAADGYNEDTSGDFSPIFYLWRGKSWSKTTIPVVPKDWGDPLAAVSCTSSGTCVAVGGYRVGRQYAKPISITWSARGWATAALAVPKGATQFGLNSISCPTTGWCQAVGYEVTAKTQSALAELWDGHRWAIEPLAGSASAQPLVVAISCPAVGDCEAIGSQAPSGKADNTILAERWQKGVWSLQAIGGSPGSYGQDGIRDISCAEANWCAAVGGTDMPTIGLLAEVWDGSSWRVQPATSPKFKGTSGILDAISCPVAGRCTAIGVWSSTPSTYFAEGPSGKDWAPASMPQPGHIYQAVDTPAVSCLADGHCEVVGSYENDKNGEEEPFAEGWDGQAWSLQPFPA